MYTLYCDRCGFSKESDYVGGTDCPNCGEALIIEDEAGDESIVNDIDIVEELERIKKIREEYTICEENIDDIKWIKSMKRCLKKLGHKQVWKMIEDMPKPCSRAYYRNIFKKAGGKL